MESVHAVSLRFENEIMQIANENPFAENLLKKSKSTIERHIRELRNFGVFLESRGHAPSLMQRPADWKQVKAKDVHDYKNYLLYGRGLAVSTVNQIIFIVRSYAALSAAHDGMSESEYFKTTQQARGIRVREADRIDALRPVTRSSNKKQQAVAITRLDAERLKHEQPDDPRGRRDALMMCLLLDYGLRISDVISLTMQNIDMNTRTVSVKTQKTGTNLYLSMTDDIYQAADRYFKHFTPAAEDTPIWYGVNKHGQIQGGFSKHSAQMRIKQLGEAVGIEGFSAHDCRHYWVTAADRGGSSLLAITEAGGWTSPTMPARYINKSKVSNANIKLG